MTEQEIYEIYRKSIWDMTVAEIIENGLAESWVKLVDMGNEDDE